MFKTLYISTSKFIERVAGYLEMGFNPFASQGPAAATAEGVPTAEKSEGEEEIMD